MKNISWIMRIIGFLMIVVTVILFIGWGKMYGKTLVLGIFLFALGIKLKPTGR